jgi:hypothetical protein
MSAMAIYQQSTVSMTGFGLESGADDHVLPRVAVVSCLRSPVPFGSGETSRIQRMVESEAQEEMART